MSSFENDGEEFNKPKTALEAFIMLMAICKENFCDINMLGDMLVSLGYSVPDVTNAVNEAIERQLITPVESPPKEEKDEDSWT